MKVYYGGETFKYYKNKTLLPQLSANESEYGTASITGQYTGQAYMFTTIGDGDLFSRLNTTMVFTFDFNPDYYIPEGTVCHFDVIFGNIYADTSYCGTGVKIVATYTDDTTSTLYDNNAMVTLTYTGEDLPASADCLPTLGVVKSISVTPYSTARQSSAGKYYVARDFRMNTVVEGTADDYDYIEGNVSYQTPFIDNKYYIYGGRK